MLDDFNIACQRIQTDTLKNLKQDDMLTFESLIVHKCNELLTSDALPLPFTRSIARCCRELAAIIQVQDNDDIRIKKLHEMYDIMVEYKFDLPN